MRYRLAVPDVQSAPCSSSKRRLFCRSVRVCGSFCSTISSHKPGAFTMSQRPSESVPPAAAKPEMAGANLKKRSSDLPHFESVTRIASIPLVENSIQLAGNVYLRIKQSNSLMTWGLNSAEQSLALATATARPAIYMLNGPITTIDQLLCKGIDIVEQRVPAIHLPPQLIYKNTREYVSKKIVGPVFTPAGSMKQIGSHAADVAADTLDGALTVADEYVDRYLPADPTDKPADEVDCAQESKPRRTFNHGARFSRKLKRRLTRRTMAEAKALKEQGTECIHILLYVAELVATDPKLAYEKAKELWASLSLPEPENQGRPETLEQLLVLLTRESTRRIVHVVNGTVALSSKLPRRIRRFLVSISHDLLAVAGTAIQMMPDLEKSELVKSKVSTISSFIERLFSATNHFFDQLAVIFLAKRPKAKKVTPEQDHQYNHNNHMPATPTPTPTPKSTPTPTPTLIPTSTPTSTSTPMPTNPPVNGIE